MPGCRRPALAAPVTGVRAQVALCRFNFGPDSDWSGEVSAGRLRGSLAPRIRLIDSPHIALAHRHGTPRRAVLHAHRRYALRHTPSTSRMGIWWKMEHPGLSEFLTVRLPSPSWSSTGKHATLIQDRACCRRPMYPVDGAYEASPGPGRQPAAPRPRHHTPRAPAAIARPAGEKSVWDRFPLSAVF